MQRIREQIGPDSQTVFRPLEGGPCTKPNRRFVDLSICLENDALSDPPPLAPKITYLSHADTVPKFMVMLPCGMGYAATMYLLERGVRLSGTDAWRWDAPFSYTAEKVAETGDTSLIWEGHKAGRDIGYCHLEKLHNLAALPGTGFTVSCLPHKIRGASAGWTRAVAIFEEGPDAQT